MSPERVERLRRLHEVGSPVRLANNFKPLDGNVLKKIIDEQKRTPGVPLMRLSALTGVSVYTVKKYLALSAEERAALLKAVGVDESVGESIDTTPRRRGRPRGTFIPSDALPDVHDDE
ncbi:TPA: hypothetical protein JZG45_005549 [Escherichia coli]|nr:hypothetical protein [Escherichia coli]